MFSFLKKALAALCLVAGGSAMATISSPSASSDSTNLYYQFTYSGTPSFLRAYLDTDKNSGTGYKISGIGANYLLENGNLYSYSGSNGGWGWTRVKVIPMTNSNLTVRWTVAKADVGSPAGVNLVFQHSNPTTTSAVISQIVTAVTSNSISLSVAGAPNLPYNGTSTLVTVGFVGSNPSRVDLSRDGGSAFATWPSGTFFTLASDGKSISGQWCISASCWSYQTGTHVLTAVATYADGSTKSSSVTLNVTDSSTTTTTVPTVTWTRCATEGGVCSFSGTRQVRYGANGSYNYLTATSSINCDNATFGDPAYGIAKACDYSSVVQTVTTTTLATPTTTTTVPPTTTTTTLQATSGPTYYVSPSGNDLNAGTASAPWRTIQKAANTVVAGDTVILMDGTYEEPSITIDHSGTALKPIVFKAQNKWLAILASMSGCNPGISVHGSYIKVKGIRFTLSPRNPTCTTYTSANVDIRAWNTKAPTPSSPSNGTEGFGVDGIKVDASSRCCGVKSNQDYTIIENSVIDQGIETFATKDSIIRNNTITSPAANIIPIVVKGGVRNAQIYGNTIYNKFSGGTGIIVGGYSCDLCFFDTTAKIEAYNSVAYNNVLVNQSGGTMYALQFMGAKDSAFFNNVVINGNLSSSPGGHNSGFQYPTTNPTFQNNIVLCSGGYLSGGLSYSGTLNVDYNNFTNCNGAIAQPHNVAGTASFVNNNSDWHLQPGSAGINAGTALSFMGYDGVLLDLSRDKDGVVRTTPWDLGVYNVTP